MRRLTHDGSQIADIVPDPEHSYRKRRKQIRFRQRVGETPAISHLLVHTVDRGDVVRLGHDIAQDFQRGRKRHTIFEQKTERSDDARGTPVTHRTGNSRKPCDGGDDPRPPFAPAQPQPGAEDQRQADPEKKIDIGTQPNGGSHDQRGARIETPAEVFKYRFELRDDIDQKKQKDDRGGTDQKQGIADRRVDPIGHQLPARPVFDDRAQHCFELARRLAHPHHGDIGGIDDRRMAFQGLREALARGDRCSQPIGETRKTLAGVVAERLERRFER